MILISSKKDISEVCSLTDGRGIRANMFRFLAMNEFAI